MCSHGAEKATGSDFLTGSVGGGAYRSRFVRLIYLNYLIKKIKKYEYRKKYRQIACIPITVHPIYSVKRF